MPDETEITMMDLIIYLRQSLLDARKKKDMERLSMLFTVISIMEDAADSFYANREGEFLVLGILTELECSIRDSLHGEDWKSTVPSVDEIKAAFTNSSAM